MSTAATNDENADGGIEANYKLRPAPWDSARECLTMLIPQKSPPSTGLMLSRTPFRSLKMAPIRLFFASPEMNVALQTPCAPIVLL